LEYFHFQDLLRRTPPEHIDYEDIEKAMAKVQVQIHLTLFLFDLKSYLKKDTAKYINEHKRSMENIERMTDIKQQLRGLRSKRIKVTFP